MARWLTIVTMPVAGIQIDNQSEVRHIHHGRHLTEHDDNGYGTPRTTRTPDAYLECHQPSLHCHLYVRVRYETDWSTTVLFQTTMEHL